MEAPASYSAFLERKTQLGHQHGIDLVDLPDFLFQFQAALTDWAIRPRPSRDLRRLRPRENPDASSSGLTTIHKATRVDPF